MTLKTHYGRLLSVSALAIMAAAALAGCGGGSTNGDALGFTPSAYPYLFAYQENTATTATGIEVSGLGIGATANPAAGDTFLFSFSSSNSAPTSTLPGTGAYQLGLADGQLAGGTFAAGTVIPAAAPGGTYIFRGEGIQGQVNHTVENITSATITPPGGAAQPFGFGLASSTSATPPAGPFSVSGYVATVTIPASLGNGVYPFSTTITDAAGHSTTTVFQAAVLKPGFAAIASSQALTLTGVTPTATYGPDANGTTVIIVPAGTYAGTVGGNPITTTTTNSAGVATTTPGVTLATGTVTCE